MAPLTRLVVSRLVAPNRESLADVAAVGVTRFPPALAAALEKIAAAPSSPAAGAAVAHLWLVPPPGTGGTTTDRVFDPPPPVADRVETLLEL